MWSAVGCDALQPRHPGRARPRRDRKSTRLNSSHLGISYAVFCLKKKKIGNTFPPKYSATHTQTSLNNHPMEALSVPQLTTSNHGWPPSPAHDTSRETI